MAEIEVLIALPEGISVDETYAALRDFARYPELAETVLSVTCGAHSETGQAVSTWNVTFREGVLQWTELDHFLDRERTIRFELIEGDLDQFSGQWSIVEEPDRAAAILFQAEFNLGIPTLSHILDPLAIESLGCSVRQIVEGLLARVEKLPPAGLMRPGAQAIGSC